MNRPSGWEQPESSRQLSPQRTKGLPHTQNTLSPSFSFINEPCQPHTPQKRGFRFIIQKQVESRGVYGDLGFEWRVRVAVHGTCPLLMRFSHLSRLLLRVRRTNCFHSTSVHPTRVVERAVGSVSRCSWAGKSASLRFSGEVAWFAFPRDSVKRPSLFPSPVVFCSRLLLCVVAEQHHKAVPGALDQHIGPVHQKDTVDGRRAPRPV